MNDDREKSGSLTADFIVLGVTVSIASLVIPALFPGKIDVAPLLLFGIVFISNTSQLLVAGDTAAGRAGISSPVFFARLTVSTILSALLILIEQFVRTIG